MNRNKVIRWPHTATSSQDMETKNLSDKTERTQEQSLYPLCVSVKCDSESDSDSEQSVGYNSVSSISANNIISTPNSASRRNSSFSFPNRVRKRLSEATIISALSGIGNIENEKADSPLGKLMKSVVDSGSDVITKIIATRCATIESIIWLGRHLPRCVLGHLINEITFTKQQCGQYESDFYSHQSPTTTQSLPIQMEDDNRQRKLDIQEIEKDVRLGFIHVELPYVQCYQCALLFIDISGFTALSNLLDVESLSKVINDYFEMIVHTVISHGGDVLKFAGDAIFSEWRVVSHTSQSSSSKSSHSTSVAMTMEDCILAAATCGAKVVAKCTDYAVFPSDGPKGGQAAAGQKIASLNVHCGVGVGDLTSIHVGNYHSRRELLLIGDPINQVTKAEEAASLGEVVASPEALTFLSRKCDICISSGVGQPLILASREKEYFTAKDKLQKHFKTKGAESIDNMISIFQRMDTTALKHLQRKISLYVHNVVVKSEMNIDSLYRWRRKATQERQRAEAELRSVYTMFIMPLISTEQGSDRRKNKILFKLLNDIMNLVTDVLKRFMGHLRQFIIDDKGVVLIATFGLRGSTTPNMIMERALPATMFLHRVLKTDLGVDNHIGATFGKAYCGIVGGILRHEYAVLGKSVNLSARLMCLKNHPGVVVDDAVKYNSGPVGIFRHLQAVKAKGYSNLVTIFEPLTVKERRWGDLNKNFVGRKQEVGIVCNLAKEIATTEKCPSKMILLSGDSGSGKTSIVVQTIALLNKIMTLSGKKFIITRNVSNEGDSTMPFSLLRSIFRDVLFEMKMEEEEDASMRANSSFQEGGLSLLDKDWDNMSLSAASTGKIDEGSSLDRISNITKELNAPNGFLEIVSYHLMGHKETRMEKEKPALMDEIINFMAKAFSRCTCHAELIVLAIDDVQYVDASSWKVIRRIFAKCHNVLIFCSSRPLELYRLSIDDDFWLELTGQYKAEKRFFMMKLGSLEQHDIVELMAKHLSCEPKEIDEDLSNYVFKQSGGMPYFASEIVTKLKTEKLCKRLLTGKIGWRLSYKNVVLSPGSSFSFGSVDELILHRIDKLGDAVREILHIAAVLGSTFELIQVMIVYVELFSIADSEKESAAKKVRHTLDLALKERILEESFDLDHSDYSDNIELVNAQAKDNQTRSIMNSKRYHEEILGVKFENKQYRFYHDTWKRSITSLILDSTKIDIHKNVAVALERSYLSEEKHDYRSKIQLYRHWKACGETLKSSKLALEIGKSFTSLGLNNDSVQIYDDALDIWRIQRNGNEESFFCGFPIIVLDALDAANLKCIVKLLIAKGKALGNLVKGKEGAEAYQSALKILRKAPTGDELQDRSFTFPIFSGLLFLLKYGSVVDPQHEIAYERELVANFVLETKYHGDPVHYTRALAMEVDFNCRLGNWEEALLSHSKVEDIYDVEEHTARVCEAYGSDRSGQSFGASARCYNHLGDTRKALEVADHIVTNLLPKMDITNTHNSFVMFYPVLWIMKDNGLASQARRIFRKYVLEAFNEHYGEGASTPGLSFFKPIDLLLDVFGNDPSKEIIEEYTIWVLDEKNYSCVPGGMNRCMARFGRCADSIFAEICLLLYKQISDKVLKSDLIHKGFSLAQKSLDLAQGQDGSLRMHSAYDQVKPVYEELMLQCSYAKRRESTIDRISDIEDRIPS